MVLLTNNGSSRSALGWVLTRILSARWLSDSNFRARTSKTRVEKYFEINSKEEYLVIFFYFAHVRLITSLFVHTVSNDGWAPPEVVVLLNFPTRRVLVVIVLA